MLVLENEMTGVKIQIANVDFNRVMNWNEAKKACEELGGGWRLPTFDELCMIYSSIHLKGEGNFQTKKEEVTYDDGNYPIWGNYWSSTDNDERSAYGCSFESDSIEDCKTQFLKDFGYRVRAVKNI